MVRQALRHRQIESVERARSIERQYADPILYAQANRVAHLHLRSFLSDFNA
jgi:hypothetical protein